MFDKQCLAIIGLQWGDEGKGKLVDYFAKDYDAVVRFNGGPNAGHTVYHDGKKFGLHQVPSGVFREKQLVIGPECYVDIRKLFDEISMLVGYGFRPKIYLDKNATMILDNNIRYDQNNKDKGIRTTGCGVGPAAAGRASRIQPTAGDMASAFAPFKEFITISDTWFLLRFWLSGGQRVLFEGAQAIGLDNIHGDYPNVSQRCMTGGIFTSFGYSRRLRDSLEVLGVAKAYVTRSGAGPMPTELPPDEGRMLRELGHEYGVTTKRARRIGWLDLPQLRKAVHLSGADSVALTKIDVLNGYSRQAPVCQWHKCGSAINAYPLSQSKIDTKPVYKSVETESKPYVKFVEAQAGIGKVSLISNGPGRDDILRRPDEGW